MVNNLLTEETYQKFRTLIYNNSGLHFNSSNRAILESRLRERLRLKTLQTNEEYYQLVSTNKEELKILLDAVTTNLTKFFRNLPQYETLQHYVVPHLVDYKRQRKLKKHIKVWSAGCSTGEEPYTNAICLSEWLPADFTFEIVASDLSLRVLEIARKGQYSNDRCADIPPLLLQKYFTADPSRTSYTVNSSLKEHITFDYHNLMYNSGRYGFDVVFCRNVLIYFDERAQREVVNLFYQAMSDYSYLFLGHSESLFGLNTLFQFVKTDASCIYGKLVDAIGS